MVSLAKKPLTKARHTLELPFPGNWTRNSTPGSAFFDAAAILSQTYRVILWRIKNVSLFWFMQDRCCDGIAHDCCGFYPVGSGVRAKRCQSEMGSFRRLSVDAPGRKCARALRRSIQSNTSPGA